MNYELLYSMLAVYLGFTALLGYLGYRHTKSAKDYIVAGGNVHPVLMSLAYGSTFISTSAIVGFGGAAGVYGLSLLWLTVCNIFFGVFIAFTVFGRKTRQLASILNVQTFPELIGARFQSPFIRRFAAVLISITMPLYASAVMIGGARYMEEALGFSYLAALVLFAVIVLGYVFYGGLKGIIYNDALQSVIMIVGMVFLIVLTYSKLGGVIAAHAKLTALTHLVPANLVARGHQGWAAMPKFGSEIWWFVISSLILGVGIGVLAQPQLVVRFMTVSGSKELYRGLGIGAIFILLMTGVAFTVGALSNVYFVEQTGGISLFATAAGGSAPNTDKIIPLFITQAMPEWMRYLFLFTLLSAAMSTLSGQFHIISTSVCYDLKKGAVSDKKRLILARIGIVIGFAVTLTLSLILPAGIIAIVTAIFFGLCAAAFLPLYTAALYWPKVTKQGAIWSMVTASVSYVALVMFVYEKEAAIFGVCKNLFGVNTIAAAPLSFIDPLVISLPLSAIILILVSLVTQVRGGEDRVSDSTVETA